MTISHDEREMDWQPLLGVLGEDGVGDWMWMGTAHCPVTGRQVHFYKHHWSRRYLRLDAEGRVYTELLDGEPVPVPHCGGATLVLELLMACAWVPPAMPPRIAIPEAVRTENGVDDLQRLVDVLDDARHDLQRYLAPTRSQAPTSSGG